MHRCFAADDPGPKSVEVCVSDYAGDCCGVFTNTIQIKFCPAADDSDDFYVYQLKNVPVCDMAYCAVRSPDATNGTHGDSLLHIRTRYETTFTGHMY